LDKQKKSLEGKEEDYITLANGVAVVIALLFQLLMTIYYSIMGNRFSSNTIMLILSALQIVTIFITCMTELNKKTFSTNIEDHKFHRFYRLFNVVLDYIYYPMGIYLLIV
jgi:hypothetical protein